MRLQVVSKSGRLRICEIEFSRSLNWFFLRLYLAQCMADTLYPFCDLRLGGIARQEVSQLCYLGQRFIKGGFQYDTYDFLADVAQKILLLRKVSNCRDCNNNCGKKHQNLKASRGEGNSQFTFILLQLKTRCEYSRVQHPYQWGHVSPSLTFYEASEETTVQGMTA